ncbi:phosphate transport system protein [Pilibacter termitis]|uniref:Phosphate-specific transport system accessory protein PhoU n=1 Tax=Pilibacter termitis TaxID=263852 RepID=A0A1T4QIM4_9ENTE|nr:phosphate signaling complex protein PhoU [Pilibacter termitis]SKA03554.1 phosphate transport system protein [Pilibacter termitis]
MLRSQFEEQLTNLHNQFYEMGTVVSEAIHKSVRSFVDHDRKIAQEVIDNDTTINEMEIHLEKKSFEMIALQQPMASDLRSIITVMKASSDLERIGDHAVSIAKATINLKGEERMPEVEAELAEMSEKVKKMVDEVLAAYVSGDVEAAKRIAKYDERVNELFEKVHRHAIRGMQQNVEAIIAGNDYLHVATFLERIGDYVTNIAEWIVYLSTGKITELAPSNDTDEA